MVIGFRDIIISEGSWGMKAVKLFDLLCGTCIGLCLRQRKRSSFNVDRARKILIVRPGGIGDAVFILAVMRSLKKQRAEISMDILCEGRNKNVFTSQTDLSLSVHCYDQPASFFSIFKNKYDVVVDTEQWHYLSAVFCSLIRASYRIGFATRPLRAKFFDDAVSYANDGYELENFKDLFKPWLKGSPLAQGIQGSFVVDARDRSWVDEHVAGKFITLNIGASIQARYLTEPQIAAIAKAFIRRGHQVVLLGSRQDVRRANHVQADIQSPQLLNFAGKTTLGQAAALMQASDIVFTSDSGLAHIATAVGAFTVVFFGPGNRTKWSLAGPKNLAFSLGLPCSPCTHFGYTIPTCHKRYDCMQDFDMEKVLASIFQKDLQNS